MPADLAATAARAGPARGAAVLHLLRLAAGGPPESVGALALEDEVRPEARQAIAELREQGVRRS